MGLKLGKLPDRTPVKLTITVPPDLNAALKGYAACYNEAYAVDESLIDLIPFMLKNFLESDKDFQRISKSTRIDANTP
jgi:hypothetical protein